MPPVAAISKWGLTEDRVAKVVRSAVSHLAFMPSAEYLVVAAADKKGNLGLWNVTAARAAAPTSKSRRLDDTPSGGARAVGGDDEDGDGGSDDGGGGVADDGVSMFSVHHEYVSGLKWLSSTSPPSLLTCSYDGSLRRLDCTVGAFVLAWGDKDMEYSCMDATATGDAVLLGDKDGSLDVVDLRSRRRTTAGLALHHRKVRADWLCGRWLL